MSDQNSQTGMFAKFKKLGVIVVTGVLLAGLCAPTELWARGGGGRGGGGSRGSMGGYSGGNRGAAAVGSGGYSAGYRGTNAVAGRSAGTNAAAGSSFSSRNFAANPNTGFGASANRYGAYGGAGPYGMGYGGLGYGGMGGMGYGMGYPLFGMYGMGGMGGYGYGGGYGGGGGGYGTGNGGGYGAASATAQNTTAPTDDQVAAADSFDTQGEADFKAGNYQAAVQDWQHALVDTPHNGGAMLLLAQGLFARGQYQPAAGAVQLGMQMLPQDQWGNVVKHYTDLYPNNQDFTDQLRKLESARTANPTDPATRFLLGYEYGYLGFPTQAIAEFDKGIALRPQDRGAVTMRNLFAVQAGIAALPLPVVPTTPAAPTIPAAQPAPPIRPTS